MAINYDDDDDNYVNDDDNDDNKNHDADLEKTFFCERLNFGSTDLAEKKHVN